MRQFGFSRKSAVALQGKLVRTIRPVYGVGAGELGVVCGMYLLFQGYGITVRFSSDAGTAYSHTITFDWYDALDSLVEFPWNK